MAKITGAAVLGRYTGDQHNSFYEQDNTNQTADYGQSQAVTTRVFYKDTATSEFKGTDTRLLN